MNYSIADNDALGGFLDYTNGVGSLRSGEYVTIEVSVDPNFTKSGFGGPGYGFGFKKPGSELVLNIYTPDFHFNFSPDLTSIVVGVDQNGSSWTSTWWKPTDKCNYGGSSGFLQGSKSN